MPPETAERVNAARRAGCRVVAVGTTVVRALETVTDARGLTSPGEGWTSLVIAPDRPLRAVNGLITGFPPTVDRGATGRRLVALIDVRLAASGTNAEFEAARAKLEPVTDAVHVTGRFDYQLRVACRDTAELDRLLRHLKREGGVTYATTWWNAKGETVKPPETKELPIDTVIIGIVFTPLIARTVRAAVLTEAQLDLPGRHPGLGERLNRNFLDARLRARTTGRQIRHVRHARGNGDQQGRGQCQLREGKDNLSSCC